MAVALAKDAGRDILYDDRDESPGVKLTDAELRLLSSALHAFLDDFGHEEVDVLRDIKALIAKLPASDLPS